LKAGLADLKAASNAREITLLVGDGELTVSDVALAATEEPAQA
jgi:valyl-tRNA synthetase